MIGADATEPAAVPAAVCVNVIVFRRPGLLGCVDSGAVTVILAITYSYSKVSVVCPISTQLDEYSWTYFSRSSIALALEYALS